MRRNKGGFTLIEILTVVALIAILFVVFIPRIDFATTKARETGVMNDFRSYQLALQSVAKIHAGIDFGNDEDSFVKALNSYLDKSMQVKPYSAHILQSEKKDPWGTSYSVHWGRNVVNIYCSGADKEVGTDDDYVMTVAYDVDNSNVVILTAGFASNIDTSKSDADSDSQSPTEYDKLQMLHFSIDFSYMAFGKNISEIAEMESNNEPYSLTISLGVDWTENEIEKSKTIDCVVTWLDAANIDTSSGTYDLTERLLLNLMTALSEDEDFSKAFSVGLDTGGSMYGRPFITLTGKQGANARTMGDFTVSVSSENLGGILQEPNPRTMILYQN